MARTADRGKVYVAKESFSTELDGAPVTVRARVTTVREGHPLMNGREDLFEERQVDFDVEQATAAPGERRER